MLCRVLILLKAFLILLYSLASTTLFFYAFLLIHVCRLGLMALCDQINYELEFPFSPAINSWYALKSIDRLIVQKIFSNYSFVRLNFKNNSALLFLHLHVNFPGNFHRFLQLLHDVNINILILISNFNSSHVY